VQIDCRMEIDRAGKSRRSRRVDGRDSDFASISQRLKCSCEFIARMKKRLDVYFLPSQLSCIICSQLCYSLYSPRVFLPSPFRYFPFCSISLIFHSASPLPHLQRSEDWTQCIFLIKRKNRLCNCGRAPGSMYCGNHFPDTEVVVGKERMACPVDPTHTIFVSKVGSKIKANSVTLPAYCLHNMSASSSQSGFGRLFSFIRIYCAAIAHLLRIDCASIVQRLRSDCAAINDRSCSESESMAQRYAAMAQRSRSNGARIVQRKQINCVAIAQRWYSDGVATARDYAAMA
jgi:hypothetical protein